MASMEVRRTLSGFEMNCYRPSTVYTGRRVEVQGLKGNNDPPLTADSFSQPSYQGSIQWITDVCSGYSSKLTLASVSPLEGVSPASIDCYMDIGPCCLYDGGSEASTSTPLLDDGSSSSQASDSTAFDGRDDDRSEASDSTAVLGNSPWTPPSPCSPDRTEADNRKTMGTAAPTAATPTTGVAQATPCTLLGASSDIYTKRSSRRSCAMAPTTSSLSTMPSVRPTAPPSPRPSVPPPLPSVRPSIPTSVRPSVLPSVTPTTTSSASLAPAAPSRISRRTTGKRKTKKTLPLKPTPPPPENINDNGKRARRQRWKGGTDYEVDPATGRAMCPMCPKTFCRADLMRRHYETLHLGARRFKCQTCHKQFKRSEHLRTHINNGNCGKR